MAPTTSTLIASSPGATTTSAAPAQTSSVVTPLGGGAPPNIPNWVPILLIVFFLIAILALLYHARKGSRVWEEHVSNLLSTKRASSALRNEKLKPLKLASGRDTTRTSVSLSPPAYAASTKKSSTQDAPIAPPPPVYLASAVPEPSSEYALAHMTRANTLKNQRRGVQIISKSPPTVPTVGVVEAPLPPMLRPDGARW
ncbi:hypothetical protein K438DRAFT_1953016 [Mycena galopus ATCC 62051]|nr:hypothetical protein K438DRAFT_1953016 [Mycena galopus ATCC 62051]